VRTPLSVLLWLALVATSAWAKAPVIEGDTLVDDSLYLTVTKPASWHFLTAKEKRDRRSAIAYKNKRWGMMVQQESFPPRIMLAKYPEPYDGVNPTIAIDRYPLGELRFKDGPWIANYDSLWLKRLIFTPIVFTESPAATTLAGREAGYYRALYEMEREHAPALSISRQLWVVASPITVIRITAVAAQSGPDACTAEIAAVIASLKFTQ
jgi:hypothetical protein